MSLGARGLDRIVSLWEKKQKRERIRQYMSRAYWDCVLL